MKIKNNERHKYNEGNYKKIKRDNNKIKQKNEIQKARKNKHMLQEFEIVHFQEYVEKQPH